MAILSAMSQENLDLVRAAIDRFNRNDADGLAAICTEDFEFISVLTAVDAAAAYTGPSAWPNYFAAIGQMWSDWSVEDVQLFDAGAEAAALFRIIGTARQSGVRIGQHVG